MEDPSQLTRNKQAGTGNNQQRSKQAGAKEKKGGLDWKGLERRFLFWVGGKEERWGGKKGGRRESYHKGAADARLDFGPWEMITFEAHNHPPPR
jgi:hypothetical protein